MSKARKSNSRPLISLSASDGDRAPPRTETVSIIPGLSDRAAFAAILSLAIGLRFWNLGGPSVWMDEAVAMHLSALPVEAILFERIDNHPPLFFLIQHLWQSLFADAAFARIPAALAGIATIAAIMAMLRDLVSVRAALFGGLVLTLMTGHIYYSQEARMYALLVLGLCLAAWGAAGMAQAGRLAPYWYGRLYILGGLIALYTHVVALPAMACLAGAGLAAIWLAGRDRSQLRRWFLHNLALGVLVLPWLVQIPANLHFTGLHEPTSLVTALWYFKTMTAFPGLGTLDTPLALVLYGLVIFGLAAAWKSGKFAPALIAFALLAAYPAVLFLLSLERPLMATRTLVPVSAGMALAAGLGLEFVGRAFWRPAIAGLIVLAYLFSSAHHLAYPIKPENFGGAFAHIEAAGFDGAPVLTCVDLSASAAHIVQPEGEYYLYSKGALFHFRSGDWWQAARMSMASYARADAATIDAALGGGWQVPGGLEEMLAGTQAVAFIRPFCEGEGEEDIQAALVAGGFKVQSDTLIETGAPAFQIIAKPRTRVALARHIGAASEIEESAGLR